MDVGNDPFPREEVTGLAAFEDLEPVGQMNVVPSEPPPPPEEALHPHGPQPAAAGDRRDPTLPLDLSVEQAEGRASADDLFDSSHGQPDDNGWEDDAATQIASRAIANSPSAHLQMDWDDDDEPPTQMRPGAMFDVSPVAAPSAWNEAFDHEHHEHHEDEEEPPSPRTQIASATQTMTGGRPSPFPTSLEDRTEPRQEPAAPISAYSDTTEGQHNIGYLQALKTGDRRSWYVGGGAAAGLIVLALILRSIGGGSAPASVTFATHPSDATVLVDGKQVPGSASPYVLPELAPGKHEVLVKKSGFVDYRGSFAVAKGETRSMPTVELVPTVREVGFSVRSEPAGATIYVDGNSANKQTPARLVGISPGIHRLQLKHDGYVDFELQMFVPEATVLQLPAAELVPLQSATAAPASAEEVTAADKPEKPKSRWSRSHDDGDQGDAPKKKYSWRHDRDSASHSNSSRSTKSSAGYGSYGRAAAAPALQPMPASPAPAANSGKLGMLRVNSRPWAQVIIDGRMVGNTPQQGIPLNPGRHKVQLINPPMGLSKTISVTIKTGQVSTQVLNLAE
jgi:hypothetical protein